jgi:membrane protease YdiL (CAAX protease family)
MISAKPWKVESVIRLAMELFASISMGIILLEVLQQFWVKNPEAQQKLVFLVGTLFFHGAAILLMHLFLREHEISWRQITGWESRPASAIWFAGLAGWLVAMPVVWILNQAALSVADFIHLTPKLQPSVELLQKTQSPFQLIYFGVVAVLIAPVVEEILFRGILYPVIKQQGYPRLAWASTSLLFAATHANLVAFLPLAALAILLVVVYERTDNLLAPMLTHSLFNLTNFLFVVWQTLSPMPNGS